MQWGLSSCTAVHVFKCASASSRHRHRRAHLCHLLTVALVSFDLGFFHCFFFFFFTTGKKKILQKRHICVGDSAQTQTATAERGRECEVEMEPDYASTLVGSWLWGCWGDGDVPGGELGPGEEDSSCWQAVGSPASIPTRRELLATESNTEQGGGSTNTQVLP